MTLGTSYNGDRIERPEPWIARVPWAEVRWEARVSVPATMLRGAVVAALGDDCHIDYHQHREDGTTRQEPATVCYRVRDGRPSVYVLGPRAGDHVRELARLAEVRFPREGRVALGSPWVQGGYTDVRTRKTEWQRYELVSPYFPSEVVWRRRPRKAGPERGAWAGAALEASMRLLWEQVGLEDRVNRPLHVQVEGLKTEMVAFKGGRVHGFRARFVTNAVLPDGVALGAHRSVGFGEVRSADW